MLHLWEIREIWAESQAGQLRVGYCPEGSLCLCQDTGIQ